jgi:hypothetical protein
LGSKTAEKVGLTAHTFLRQRGIVSLCREVSDPTRIFKTSNFEWLGIIECRYYETALAAGTLKIYEQALEHIEAINNFTQKLVDALNNTRLYENNGFTPAELFEHENAQIVGRKRK